MRKSSGSAIESLREGLPEQGAFVASGTPDGALAPVVRGPLEEAGDARLVEQARHGDDRAFRLLVERYERTLLRVLSRMVRDDELARDLAQETFWRVYTRLDRFDTGRRFAPWLFQIGVRLCLDELRRRAAASPSVPVLSIDQSTDRNGSPLDVPDPDPREQLELAQEVHHVLGRLGLPYRTVLVLRDLEGFSSAEVAAIIGKREATVRWRLARAREMFREHWLRRDGVATLGVEREARDGA